MVFQDPAVGIGQAMPNDGLTGLGVAIDHLLADTTSRQSRSGGLGMKRLNPPVLRIFVEVR
jgi:hypothetical protein